MKNDGLNSFDVVYYINLEHRKDRFEHINKELRKTNIEASKINRIDGVYMKEFGCLGASKSHAKALESFLKTPDNVQNCIIFEDDFMFTQSQEKCNEMINDFFSSFPQFDVLMLSSNTFKYKKTYFPFVIRIENAQTLSGYCVSKKFAPVLLQNFKESIYKLEKAGRKTHDYCIDIYMKRLQRTHEWFCLEPKIGLQMDNYSDIERRNVSYKC